jgi:hypothetical protein
MVINLKDKNKKGSVGTLTMKADEFDEIMQRALSVAPKPVAKRSSKKSSHKKKGDPHAI